MDDRTIKTQARAADNAGSAKRARRGFAGVLRGRGPEARRSRHELVDNLWMNCA
jgi:hypothetical protein